MLEIFQIWLHAWTNVQITCSRTPNASSMEPASAGTLWPEFGPRWDQDLTKRKQVMSGSWVTHEWFMSGQWVWVMIGSWIACLSNMHIFKSTARGTRNQVGIEFAQPSWVCNKNSSWVSAVSLFMSGQWKNTASVDRTKKCLWVAAVSWKTFMSGPGDFFFHEWKLLGWFRHVFMSRNNIKVPGERVCVPKIGSGS